MGESTLISLYGQPLDQVWIRLAIKGYWGRFSHISCGGSFENSRHFKRSCSLRCSSHTSWYITKIIAVCWRYIWINYQLAVLFQMLCLPGFFLVHSSCHLFFTVKNIILNWDTWIESRPFPCSFLLAGPRQRRAFWADSAPFVDTGLSCRHLQKLPRTRLKSGEKSKSQNLVKKSQNLPWAWSNLKDNF